MRRFEYKDAKSNKFWEVEVKGKNLQVTFGKIGTEGQSKPKAFATPEKAKAEMEKLIKEKTGKGYVEVGGKAVKAEKPAAGKKTSFANIGAGLSKAEKRAKAEKVLQLFSAGDWHLGRMILESCHQETWLYEELVKGVTIENGKIKPSPVIKKYFSRLTDEFGNSLNNSEMVILAVLAEAPVSVIKECRLEINKIQKAYCIPNKSNLEYFGHIYSKFTSVKNWKVSPGVDLFEIESLSDSAAKLLSQWWDMESVRFDNLANLSDKAINFLCSPCPEYFSLPALKNLSGAAAKSFVNLLERGAQTIYLQGLENISDEAVKFLSKGSYYWSKTAYYIFNDNNEGLVIPENLQKLVEEFKEKQPKKK